MRPVILALILVSSLCAAPALVAHTAATSSTDVTTSAIDTTGANFIIAATIEFTGEGTFSDSKSNTWTALTLFGSSFQIKFYYCIGCTVGTGHTFTLTKSTFNFPTVTVAAFSGVKTSSPQDGSTTGLGDQTAMTIQPGSITPSVAGDLFVTAINQFGSGSATPTIDSSFTITDAVSSVSSGTLGYGMAYKISGSAENPTWTGWTSGTGNMSTTMAAFFAAPTGGTGVKHRGQILE